MKGYTIQHSIELLEEEVKNGGGSGGSTTAANVSYDNTDSGLTAETVQAALDEIDGNVDTLSTAVNTMASKFVISGTEHVVGKWLDDRDIYEKAYTTTASITLASQTWTTMTGVELDNPDIIVSASIYPKEAAGIHNCNPVMASYDTDGVLKALNFRNASISCDAGTIVVVRYVKTAPVTNTRKKK